MSGYYPDPSIPGYIRYWNGTSWVPGTSRPAPGPGEPAPAPPTSDGVANVSAARGPEPALDEEEAEEDDEIDLGRASSGSSLPEVRARGEVAAPGRADGPYADWDDPRRLHGNQPEAAAVWQPDAGRQPGFGAEQQDMSWGTPQQPALGGHDPRAAWDARRDEASPDAGGLLAGGHQAGGDRTSPDRTVGMRMPLPEVEGERGGTVPAQPDHTVGLRRSDVFQHGVSGAVDDAQPPAQQYQAPQREASPYEAPRHQIPQQPEAPQQYPAPHHEQYQQHQHGAQNYQGHQEYAGQGAPQQQYGGPAVHGPERPPWEHRAHGVAQQAGPQPGPGAPQQHIDPGGAFAAGGPAAGQDGVAPWRPPAADPFAEAARDAHPAGLGRGPGGR
ncbi:hypothetical protein N566_27775, partial [Streptomycetaceae bacterium MP113-05]